MDITIQPRLLRGTLSVIPSKSMAHRMLICAAFADSPTQLHCHDTNRDIEATAQCLRELGAKIQTTSSGYSIVPAAEIPEQARLNCGESGSTLRFLLPVCGALGVDTTFVMEGRLPYRPLSPLWEEMERMGCSLSRPTDTTLRCSGKLKPGAYTIAGNVSSQYITGLLLGLSLIADKSTLEITGTIESKPYITMTYKVMQMFGVDPNAPGTERFHSPGQLTVEGDWSNGAFFLAANFLDSYVNIEGLSADSPQGDKMVAEILQQMKYSCPTVSAADIPDLIPVLSVAAAFSHGAVFTDIQRLRLKESDRVSSIVALINSLGGCASASENTLSIEARPLSGGTVCSYNDHRIAMSAAIAATACTNPVTILGAEAVNKSYPRFWEEYARLGGNYEQHIR